MVNTKAKGDRRERSARDILKSRGWSVESPNATPYPQPHGVDFFGEFDIIAFKKGEKPLFIQVKSNTATGIETFHENCNDINVPFEFVNVEFWVCIDREGWKTYEIDEDGHELKHDEREEEGNMGDYLREQYDSLKEK